MLKRLRRYICVLLTAAMVMMFTPVFGITVSADTSGDGWSFDEATGALTITTNGGTTSWRSSCDKTLVQSVEIQEGVTSIGSSAFSGCTALVSIEIPDSVMSIGNQAFTSCYKLESIKIPNGVTSIGLMTFWDCLDLASIEIPDSVTSIGNFAFVGCRSLTSIEMPNNVISIGWSAFYDCTGLVSIEIPDSVTSIGGAAFEGCSNLTSITIPNSVESIGDEAFKDCSSLDKIIYPSGLDVSNASIPDTATQVKYTVNNGEVTITEIILPDGKDSVEIPDTIGGKTVTIPKELMKDVIHDHEGGTATCQKVAVCDICGQEYGDLAAHSLTHTELKEATCTEDGNIEYWTCSVCEKYFSDANGTEEVSSYDIVIDAFGHNYENGICTLCYKVDPDHEHTGGTATCIQKAVCDICGKEYGDLASHRLTKTAAVPATCTETGKDKYWTCSVCGEYFSDENGTEKILSLDDIVIAALGHDYVNGKCTRCQEIKPDHEHIGGTATCTQKAVCDICGEEYGELAAHASDSGTVTKKPTTSETGVKTFKCTVCGYVIKTETIPALGGGSETPTEPSKPTDPLDPSEPTDPVIPDKPFIPSRPDNGIPFIKNENGATGWDVIKAKTENADRGSVITIDMNGVTVVPGNIFDAFKGKDVTVVFDLGEDITWSVNGKDITSDKTSDIDFSVKADTKNIPVDVINNITGERYSIQISLSHNGELGFTAVLSINLGSENAELYAALYFYNDGDLTFVDESMIAGDGTAKLKFTHASDYLIVIDEKSNGNVEKPDNSGETSEPGKSDTEDDNPSTGIAVSLTPLTAALAVVVITANRRRK